ncbi:fatty acid desaturase [Roseomonas marmotae]|uniref:Fatty acid desaturase n=1 Tax=Roseomonas marmotae TaxID=2768161 RepID=A0ABS3K7N3_9PROT|nr:fatty acid desaturase [Roseomonas marmotae]MBO1073474.1 fatty acid desaturase [Roseomonas marmotae]QTI80333.1 fatty acid desaturase [Roseomonas marmotae]
MPRDSTALPLAPAARFRPPAIIPGQAAIGLSLAALILSLWLGLHVHGVYFHRWQGWGWALAPVLVAVQTWLSVGLFIIAHDAIHGSLAPGWRGLNKAMGQLCVGLYAGFRYRRLASSHHRHHAASGTEGDPDFHPGAPRRLWPWFFRFFLTYFGWAELAVLTLWVAGALMLGAALPNLLVFWALPALLSAFQLFFFGTWLPHRHGEPGFEDSHNARSNGFGPLLSLLTCFHFGRHHEHHLYPELPWWRLPDLQSR